jgi:hypothetical protein
LTTTFIITASGLGGLCKAFNTFPDNLSSQCKYESQPTTIYTSVKNFPVGWNQAEQEYAETQSLAYTKDGGHSWIKLDFPQANPVIYEWPTGFNTTG